MLSYLFRDMLDRFVALDPPSPSIPSRAPSSRQATRGTHRKRTGFSTEDQKGSFTEHSNWVRCLLAIDRASRGSRNFPLSLVGCEKVGESILEDLYDGCLVRNLWLLIRRDYPHHVKCHDVSCPRTSRPLRMLESRAPLSTSRKIPDSRSGNSAIKDRRLRWDRAKEILSIAFYWGRDSAKKIVLHDVTNKTSRGEVELVRGK